LAGHSHICENLKFLGIDAAGALQAYWTVPAYTLRLLPANLTLAHAALVEPLSVACHDVRLGGVREGHYVMVIGGGPIGTLISMVAENEGAKVLVSEVNPFRLRLISELGMEAVDPRKCDVLKLIASQTKGAGADVVFEVTGTAAGAEMMTQVVRARGYIVVVGIFADSPKVDLFRFFWRELKLCGARVYENADFERAIQLAASGVLPLHRLITEIYPLDQLESGFRQLEGGGTVMKILIKCGDDTKPE